MSKLRWASDIIDNLYCFDIPNWVIYLHPTSEGKWFASSYNNGEKKFSGLFKDLEDAKSKATKFALGSE